MKKKSNPQKRLSKEITDALITSDEFDSFDYNLKFQIKELASIGYDSEPQLWKNNLAYSYLYHAEKLLLKKNQIGDSEIENIRELQTLIKKYENIKTMLLTLRIVISASRAGIIPQIVTGFVKYSKSQSGKGSKKRGRSGKSVDEIETRNIHIRNDFKQAKLKNRHLTPHQFSNDPPQDYSIKPRQIRAILKMAVGS